MFQHALLGREKVLGLSHAHSLEVANDLKKLTLAVEAKEEEV